MPLLENSDDFVFDNQMLAQCVHFGFRIGEVSCPTKYFEEASSINFRRSVKYGFGVLGTTVQFALQSCRPDPSAALQPDKAANSKRSAKPTTLPARSPYAPPSDRKSASNGMPDASKISGCFPPTAILQSRIWRSLGLLTAFAFW